MKHTRSIVGLALLSTTGVAAAADSPRLMKFESGGRIASGTVARYDLREESTDFEYRIRAERIKVGVFRRAGGKWSRVGVVRATPPRPLNFWRVFRKMRTGRYKLVARAVSGTGDQRSQSPPRTIRFRVVDHVPHAD
jgi:hypothetical protein